MDPLYSVGPWDTRLISAASKDPFLEGIKAGLLAANWTLHSTDYATAIATVGAGPTWATERTYIGGRQYYWVDEITGPPGPGIHALVLTSRNPVDGTGGSAGEAAQNLSTALWDDPEVESVSVDDQGSYAYVTIRSKIAGLSGNSITLGHFGTVVGAFSHLAWNGTYVKDGGYTMRSVATAQNQQMDLLLHDAVGNGAGTDDVKLKVRDITGAFTSQDFLLRCQAGLQFRLLSQPHGVWLMVPTSTGAKEFFCAFTPYIISRAFGVRIANATNATPIVITTQDPHGFLDGASVAHSGILGNAAANGVFTITLIDPTSYSLNGSAGSGAPTADTGFAALSELEVGSAIFAHSNQSGTSFRTEPHTRGGTYWLKEDANARQRNGTGGGQGCPRLLMPASYYYPDVGGRKWRNQKAFMAAPELCTGMPAESSEAFLKYVLYDVLFAADSYSPDIVQTFDGHDWHQVMANQVRGGLWVVTG